MALMTAQQMADQFDRNRIIADLDSPMLGLPLNFVKLAAESRARELEAAIQRFRDCGVELARFTIQERGEVTHLCVDGVSRFNWRVVYSLPGFDAPV